MPDDTLRDALASGTVDAILSEAWRQVERCKTLLMALTIPCAENDKLQVFAFRAVHELLCEQTRTLRILQAHIEEMQSVLCYDARVTVSDRVPLTDVLPFSSEDPNGSHE